MPWSAYAIRLYLDPILKGGYPEDLLAVQYYTPIHVTAEGGTARRWPTSEADWQQIHPEGMYDILTRVTRDYGRIPITVTENGLPCPDTLAADGTVDDSGRIQFLRDHFAAAHRAISDGVPLEGYHVWSLLDNFEWAEGYDQRWGLVYVDYPTQRRVLKRSAHWYRTVIRDNGL